MTQFTSENAPVTRAGAQAHLDAPTVIRTKRDGGVLSDAAIDWVIDGYTHGRVHDEQMSALLMAIFLRGMAPGEIARWTAAMIGSGERFDFTDLRRDGRPLALVDKHSTGGVGDKITIPLVPVVMACGAAVPQAAGRGLGHTGGTLDKLESIAGFTAEISKAQIREQLQGIGAAVFAAGDLAPADRKIYALRDVTATTESLPLIASSVMSKKIAEGARALVLDSKVGRGAFLKTEAESRRAGGRRPGRRRGADAGPSAGDARRRRGRRDGSGADAGRRHGHGLLPRVGRGAGRGPVAPVAGRRPFRDHHGAARWHDG
ncbi:MAG: thymidine phosphorylase [Mycobacterium sp.]|nr:thymidine phosphorylase [Mycobacterium sp.]